MKTLKKRRFGGDSEVDDKIEAISPKLSKEDIIWRDTLIEILTELWSKKLINLSEFLNTRGGDQTLFKGGNPIKKTIKYLAIFIIGLLKGILYPVGLIVIVPVLSRVSGFVKLIFKIGSLIIDSWSGYGTWHAKEEFKSYTALWSFEDMVSLFIDHQKKVLKIYILIWQNQNNPKKYITQI